MNSEKNRLQELCQKKKWSLPRYESRQEIRPNSNPPVPMFHSTVYVTTNEGTESFDAVSDAHGVFYSTKKQAENAAAHGWCFQFGRDIFDQGNIFYESDDDGSHTENINSKSYMIFIDLDNMSHRVKELLKKGAFVVGFASPTYHNPNIENLCKNSQEEEQPPYVFQIIRAEMGCKDAADFRMAFMIGDWSASGLLDKDREIHIVSRDTGFQELVQCLINKGYSAKWVCR